MATPDNAPKSTIMPSTNRGWALDMADATVRIKPRRPYTPYNLFYLLERELVVQGNEPLVATEKASKIASMATGRSLKNIGERPEEDITIPFRYKNCVLLPYWYEPNLKEKRKHRKTHGKISFKDLTGIISKNWANIDTETKDYCTKVSEIGRKRYKETMSRYNASQKIIQLKKEHAAMENAREQRMEQQFQEKDFGSPSRPQEGNHNPSTPDRILSRHAPIVTPSHSGYNTSPHSGYNTSPHSGYNNNRITMFVPGGAHAHAFHHYGPPPPMPPSMSHSMRPPPPMPPSMSHSMQGQRPPSMPSHSMQGQHPPSTPIYHRNFQHARYNYPQAPAMNKLNNNGHNQAFKFPQASAMNKLNNNGHNQAFKFPQAPAMNKLNNNGHNRGFNLNNGVNQATNFNNRHAGRSGNNFLSSPPNERINVTVDVEVRVKKDTKGSMTHDEALRLCNLMGNDSSDQVGGHGGPTADTLLREMPSFDFGDFHSLSADDDDDLSRELTVDGLMNGVENQEGNIFDLIRSEMLPMEFGGEEAFPDFPDF